MMRKVSYWQRIRPRKLRVQLAIFVSFLLTLTIVGHAWYTAEEQASFASRAFTAQANILTRELATASTASMITRDYAILEQLVRQTAQFPAIEKITISDAAGRVMSEVAKDSEGHPKVRFSQTRLALPGGSTALTQIEPSAADTSLFGHSGTLVAWQPIDGGNLLGWVKVDYSMARVDGVKARIWRNSLVTALLAVIISAGLILAYLTRPLRSLEVATAFARDLDAHRGQQLPVSHCTEEMMLLTQALNHASSNLACQEREILAGARRLQTVLDNAADGVITLNPDGTVESFSKGAESAFGYRAADVVGQHIALLLPQSPAPEGAGKENPAGAVWRIGGGEVTARRRDGSEFPAELSISEVVLDEAPLFVGIVRDLTERKKVDRLKSEFIATVSHELRTPITSIRGSLSLVLGGVAGEVPRETQMMLEIAHNNSVRLLHLVNDILDMEKIEAGKMVFNMKPLDITEVVAQSIAANQGYADQHQVRFVLAPASQAAMVNADSDRLSQVMANLLSNAAKWSNPDDEVSIAVRRERDKVRVAVTDHGSGIPEEFRERIFSKFSQADGSDSRNKSTGTGLGLSITKKIVEHLGGDIGFDSQVGVGTTFYFDLPVLENLPRKEALSGAAASPVTPSCQAAA